MILSIRFSYCQTITGIVADKTTRQPIDGAIVSLGNLKTMTRSLGRFQLDATSLTDSLKVSHPGYKSFAIAVNKEHTAFYIELEPKAIALREVTIHANREADFKKDSIGNRVEYAQQFNYKGPRVIDAFIGNPVKQPGELLSINLLVLVQALTKKNTTEYKFNKVLLRDEHEEYIDRKFNKGIVTRVTKLMGDTLLAFLSGYRPTYSFALKATDYDMELYIKNSLKQFEKAGMGGGNPFGKPL